MGVNIYISFSRLNIYNFKANAKTTLTRYVYILTYQKIKNNVINKETPIKLIQISKSSLKNIK